MPTADKQWLTAKPMPEEFKLEHPELPEIALQLLWNRNLRSQKDIDLFLNPDYSRDVHDPFLFSDMKKAVDRINVSLKENQKILIHGDYDADGVCAATLLHSTLKALGGNPDVFLPNRERDGYGLAMATVETALKNDVKLIITCDCGISNVESVTLAQSNGIDVIITDHHQQPPELPPAFAIIHPKILGETYPCDTLAGGGVAFKLAQGLLREHSKENERLESGHKHDAYEKWLLDMVAISSVADMVPLLGETRVLVRYGLVVLGKTQRIGLRRLMKQARVLDEHGNLAKNMIEADDIGFRIAPRINAAGRMSDAKKAFDLLICDDQDHAKELASELGSINKARQEKTKELTKIAIDYVEATHTPEDPVIVAFGEDWPGGLMGLIASRLKDKYGKPTFVVSGATGEYTGSGRSMDGFNMYEGMRSIDKLFKKFGGHPQACGFTLEHGIMAEEFKSAISPIAAKQLTESAVPTLAIDSAVALDHINWQLYDFLEKFEPFGMGNPKPCFVASSCEVVSIDAVGKTGKHYRLHLRHNSGVVRKTICFNCEESCANIKPGDFIDMVFEVGVNEWNGNRELQLKIVDLKRVNRPEASESTTPNDEVLSIQY